jgi:glutathione S-transferase
MTATYQLYFAPSTASLAVHWLLLELDVEHTLIPVNLGDGEQKSARYLQLNPNGVVPTLLIDGAPMFECAAILLMLAERHPERGFAPPLGSAARAPYLQWMMHLANTLQPAFRAWFYPHEPAGPEHVDAVKAHARARIEQAWDRLDAELARRPYLAGDAVSATDFLATMLMRWSRNQPRPATQWPGIAAYVARMKARPAFREVYRREGITDWT